MKHPVDLVYVWCWDGDPGWMEKRRAVAEKYGIASRSTSNTACRYRGGDMIRFSLASAERNAPWIRHSYVVVDDDQSLPDWPEFSGSRVRIVRLSEIIPERYLPTYCSDTIEHHIARIPGLSERFLYANDDMLFWDAVDESFFFAPDGCPYLRFGARRKPTSDPGEIDYRHWLDNADALIAAAFGARMGLCSPIGRLPHHNVDAYLKSDLMACFERFHAEIEKGFAHPFRNPDSVQRVLYSDYAFAIGHGHFRRATFNTNARAAWWRRLMPSWADSLQISPGRWRDAPNLCSKYRPKLVCFNDGLATTDEDFVWLRSMLNSRWPVGGGTA